MLGLGVNVLEQGFIFSIMALGVYITYKILDFPDLSVDGTLTLGAFITAFLLVNDYHPILSTVIACIGGAIVGMVTGILHVHLKITNLLSGILVMIGLYSVNLRILGKSNLPLFNERNIFTATNNWSLIPSDLIKLYIIIGIVLAVKIAIDLFLKTKFGMVLRTTGDNPVLVTTLGVNIGKMKIIGLMLSNALVALSGSLLAGHQRFVDIGMGVGTIVIGLASVIIGEAIFGKFKIFKFTTIVVLGSIVYRSSVAITLQLGFEASDFKLISALLVIIALGINNQKNLIKWNKLHLFSAIRKIKRREGYYVNNQRNEQNI